MKQNKYDDEVFFHKYSGMERSKKGLVGAGEWKTLEKMLPDFKGKRVLDLGCGFGWHCNYAAKMGAAFVTGVDISGKMLAAARERTAYENVAYICKPVEDADFPANAFDVVLSSLALHYIASFEDIAKKVHTWLPAGGVFVFSVEHPVFTAYGSQDWYYDDRGNILHFPVDNYFYEGERDAVFLGETVMKYHRTLTTYMNGLLQNGFEITGFAEPQPPEHLLHMDGMKDEFRRPMMLIVSAKKR
jgi:SAM-dependent methyltransferase